LKKAKGLIRQKEVIYEQQGVLKDPKKDNSVTSEHNLDYVKNSAVQDTSE